MFPCSFDEANQVLGADKYKDHPSDVECLSVLKTVENNTGTPVVLSCWKCTAEELEEINKTGRVWLTVMGQTMPPVHIQGVKPLCE